MKSRTYDICAAGLCVALGLLLPLFTAHIFSVPGTVLLPMHIPVLLSGLTAGPLFGSLTGLCVPVLSCLLTNMPVAFPMLPIMVCQLFTLGLVSGLLYRKARANIFLSASVACVCGWVMYALTFISLTAANGDVLKAPAVGTAVTAGLPGILLQLLLCPILVNAVEKSAQKRDTKTESGISGAIDLIQKGKASIVILREGKIIHTADGRGVSPLLSILDEQPELLRGSVVVDKIIGKAAAALLLLGGARRCYGLLMSAAAKDYLMAHHLPAGYGRCVEYITARGGSGLCPIERSVMAADDPAECCRLIRGQIQKMRKAG